MFLWLKRARICSGKIGALFLSSQSKRARICGSKIGAWKRARICSGKIGAWIGCPLTPTLTSSEPLTLIVPIHVDDGLAICNSLPLYNWFITEISKKIDFVCLGTVSNTRYLGQRIICNHPNKTIQISQSDLILDLLEDWNMKDCKHANVPLSHNPNNLPPCQPNACSNIPDHKITLSYQHLVRSITYLAICTRPDLHMPRCP